MFDLTNMKGPTAVSLKFSYIFGALLKYLVISVDFASPERLRVISASRLHEWRSDLPILQEGTYSISASSSPPKFKPLKIPEQKDLHCRNPRLIWKPGDQTHTT